MNINLLQKYQRLSASIWDISKFSHEIAVRFMVAIPSVVQFFSDCYTANEVTVTALLKSTNNYVKMQIARMVIVMNS